MGRELRIEYKGALYLVTSRGNTRSRIFQSELDKQKFVYYLAQIHKKHSVIIHSYCLMGNYYHLLIETPNGNLKKVMHKLNTSYTNYYNYHYSRIGHLFSRRYESILVDKQNYALVLSSYIHLTPVRDKIVTDSIDYPWSSYKYYVLNKEKPDFLETKMILSLNNGDSKDYNRYVRSQIKKKFEPEKELKGDMVLGSENFFEWVKESSLQIEWFKSKDKYAIKKLYDTKELEAKIINIFKNDDFNLNANTIKKFIIYLLKKHTHLTLANIGEKYGISYSAVSVAAKRFNKEIIKTQKFSEILVIIEEKLNLSKK
ncbi:MAG: transposase [Candidatus Muirbacterium halophilum]|nr:transposase [Candidatus Muirbacterium halophilum]